MKKMILSELPIGGRFKTDLNGDFIFKIITKDPIVFSPTCDASYKFIADEKEANSEVFVYCDGYTREDWKRDNYEEMRNETIL